MTVTDAVRAVRAHTAFEPEVGLILGTGLGELGREIETEASVPYAEIPGFVVTTAETHAGRLVLGRFAGRRIVVMQGRVHRYEGYSLEQVAFPVRAMRALGADTLIVSNVCGGMHPLWAAGDLVLLADHINLMGDNPLCGPAEDGVGPRFPDLSHAYDPGLRALARAVALEFGLTVREGVYVAVPGPSLETRAEYRLLRGLGADLVGMSTIPEVLVARQVAMRVLGVSIITDLCLPDALAPTSLEQIVAVAQAAEPRFATLVRGVLSRLN